MRKTMVKAAFGVAIIALQFACGSKDEKEKCVKQNVEEDRYIEVEDSLIYAFASDTLFTKSRNDVRFGDFDEKDWYDNEYIQTLRRYLDAFNSGKIDDEGLEPYRNVVMGKFTVLNASEFLGGGMLLFVIFVDYPQNVFAAWVYSDVDRSTETVMNYYVKYFTWSDSIDITKEEILKVVSEHPENKLW